MTEKMKLYRRTLWGLLTAFLAFAFVTLMGQQTVSSDDLTDGVKRRNIDNIYHNFHTEFPEVLDITPQQAMNLIAEQKSVFIDIREKDEQEVSMLPGSITEREFLRNFKAYEDHIKIAYGTISRRSGKFAESLQRESIPVLNLEGGILAWVHDGGKIYNRNGETQQIHVYDSDWNFAPAGYEAMW